jgi:PKD repeat protein
MSSLPGRRPYLLFIIIVVAALAILMVPVASASQASGTETRISFSHPSCQNTWPSAGNGWIVWQERCSGVSRILAYNYRTGAQLVLPNATLHAYAPKIQGTRVTWYETTGSGNDIFYTDLASLPPVAHRLDLPASSKENPVMDGDWIAWQDSLLPAGKKDILLYDIATSTLYNLTPDTDASNQNAPSIGGGRVVWQDDRNGGEQDIYYNDTADWSLSSIPASPPGGVSYLQPVTDGHSIVWYEGNTFEIFQSDFSTTTSIDNDGIPKWNPAVCSTFIVWKEDTSGFGAGPYDIVLYNTATSTKETLADSQALENAAVVDTDINSEYVSSSPLSINGDSRVVWVDTRNGHNEIYMFTYGPVVTCPVVGFGVDATEGDPPLEVHFTDTSLNSPTRWYWDFGDGTHGSGATASHSYASNGIYTVRLTAATPYCRNTTMGTDTRTVSVGVPSVGFSANITEGLAPLAVAFTGTATNAPTSWAWVFGDGGTSTLQNPIHTYAAGEYPLTLEATNAVGTGTKSRIKYITALNGLKVTSLTTIPGISGTGQQASVDKSLDPVLSPDSKTLVVRPSPGYGWQNITFLSDASGFTDPPLATTGTITGVIFQTVDIIPTMFTVTTGNNLPINYQFRARQYENGGILTTQLWEGASPADEGNFTDIIHGSMFTTDITTDNVAYTLTMNRDGISTPASLRLNLSVGSDWETGTGDIAAERLKTFVIADGFNANGDHVGTVLPATYIRNDTTNDIEYFIADVPPQYAFMNKFALARLSGSGNPFQLITLTVAKYASAPASPSAPSNSASGVVSDSDSQTAGGGGGGTVVQQGGPAMLAPVEEVPDPGKTATVFTNAEGVTSQGTILTSTDRLATVSIGEGITAKDDSGKPIASISIAAVPSSGVPSLPGGGAVSFAGRTYNLGPDGATFSPPGIALTFTVPQAQWGQEYTIRIYDAASGTWQELPSTFDSRTGTVTARITHFCYVALVVRGAAPAATVTIAKTPVPTHTQAAPVQQPPSTALSIFAGMVFWAVDLVLKNGALVIGIVIACLVIAAWRGLRMNRGNY